MSDVEGLLLGADVGPVVDEQRRRNEVFLNGRVDSVERDAEQEQ